MNVKINDGYSVQSEYDTMVKENPATKQFYREICNMLKCEVKDLVMLSVHPDFEQIDKDGCNVKSFFPAGSRGEFKLLYNARNIGGIYFGSAYYGVVNGIPFFAQYNNSSFGMFANKNLIL